MTLGFCSLARQSSHSWALGIQGSFLGCKSAESFSTQIAAICQNLARSKAFSGHFLQKEGPNTLRLGTLLAVCPLIIEFERTRLGTHGGKGPSSEQCSGLLPPLLGQREASSRSSKLSHTFIPSFERCSGSARHVQVH